MSFAINKPREYLFAHPEKGPTPLQTAKFNELTRRRRKGEPVAYLTGKKEFYGLELIVNKNVLIPRPETEMLVDLAIKKLCTYKGHFPISIVDTGTGSGNIIISIVKNIPAKRRKKMNFYATDISEKPLAIARSNARKHKVSKFIKFIKSDLLSFARGKKLSGNVLIAANLPYVSPKLYKKYQKNLRYEPKKALISEKKGLGHYLRLIQEIKELYADGLINRITGYLEINPEQKAPLAKIIRKRLPAAKLTFARDLAGKWRMARLEADR